jgi:hypothetical protein
VQPTENCLVDQGKVGPAVFLCPNFITRAVGVIQFDWLPPRFPYLFYVYRTLY